MALKQRLIRSVVHQFANPTGIGGRVVGWVMAHRDSNVRRSRWAVELLDLQPTDRVLEVGCGPGVAVSAAAQSAARVVGVDRSSVMIGAARRRNASALRAGRVELVQAAVEDLPPFEAPFDKALAVNTLGHWDDPVGGLRAIQAALRPGGTIAVVAQPRLPGATAADSTAAAEGVTALLDRAGYRDVRVETLNLMPPAVCVLARRPLPS